MNTKTLLIYLFALFTFYFSLFPCFGQNEPRLVLPVGHTGIVYSAEFSPDGQRIVTASRDNTAKVWDASTGKLLYSLEGHTDCILSAVFSPDGQRIVTASKDKTAKVWDASSGKLLFDMDEHQDWVESASFRPDGKRILTVSKHIKVWDASNGKLLLNLVGYYLSAEFSPDGNWIVATMMGGTIRILKPKNGKREAAMREHTSATVSVKFSTDGKRIVTGSLDGTAKVWDIKDRSLLFSLEDHKAEVVSAEFSFDSKKIVTASLDGTAKVWDAARGKLLRSLEGHTGGLNSATFSFDGKQIVTASLDGTAKVWDAASGKLLHSLEEGLTGEPTYVAMFSPEGKKLVTIYFKTVKVWDAQNGDLLFNLKGHTCTFYSFKSSCSSNKAVSGSSDGIARIWNVENGTLSLSLKSHQGGILSADLSPYEKRLVTGSWDGIAKVWDLSSEELLYTLKHSDEIRSVSFSPNGKRIVTASEDETAKVWEAESGKLLFSLYGHTDWVNSASFSPTGQRIVTASGDRTAKVWDAESGKLLFSLYGHTDWVSSASFSPDEQRIVTASADKTAKVWDAESGKLLYSLEGHTDHLRSAVFSPDGLRIVTASKDNTAKVWESESGKFLKSIILDGGFCKEVNFEKNQLISHKNSMLTIWDMESGKEILSWVAVDSNDWIITHPSGLFDATPGAMDKIYYVQGLDIIEFEQLKDRYWEPGLWKKVMNGEELRDVQGFDKALPLFPKVENLAINYGKIEFELIDNGGGIGKYMIYVNDKEVFVGNQGGNENIKDGRLMVSYKLEGNQYLKPGNENQIKVKAYNAENYIVSRGATVQYKHKEEKRINPSIFIVSCGVSDYTGDAIDLRYAAKDAEDIHHSLHIGAEKLFGEDKTFQYLLTTNKEKEKWPTKENIKSTFKEIAAKAKSTDVIVLYLSGHGINWGGQDGDFYYLTQDAYTASGEAYNDPAIREKSTLSSNELVELFKLVPATKQVLIIDACASGQVVEDLIAQRDISSSTIRALDRMKDRTGMFIITGSAADAVSYEASKYGQGLLTYSLLEGIKGAALREGQFIDIDLLFQRAKDRVPELAEGIGGIQQPQVFFPYGSASFDIGLLEEEDKSKIPLAKEKPVFVMSQFMNSETFADELKLEYLIDEKLRNISAKGSEAELIFYDAKSFPEAYQLKGLYTLSGDEVDLKFNLFLGSEKLHSIEVRGSKTSMEDFVNEVIKSISVVGNEIN
jgi:WD40 repeat protein